MPEETEERKGKGMKLPEYLQSLPGEAFNGVTFAAGVCSLSLLDGPCRISIEIPTRPMTAEVQSLAEAVDVFLERAGKKGPLLEFLSDISAQAKGEA